MGRGPLRHLTYSLPWTNQCRIRIPKSSASLWWVLRREWDCWIVSYRSWPAKVINQAHHRLEKEGMNKSQRLKQAIGSKMEIAYLWTMCLWWIVVESTPSGVTDGTVLLCPLMSIVLVPFVNTYMHPWTAHTQGFSNPPVQRRYKKQDNQCHGEWRQIKQVKATTRFSCTVPLIHINPADWSPYWPPV